MSAFQNAFISYGRVDSKQFAKQLYERLSASGYSSWLDLDDIPFGVDYQKQINDAIDRADNVIFLISPHSVHSPYCALEIELALKRHKRIIPIMHVEPIGREVWQQRNPEGTNAQWANYIAAGKHSSHLNMHPEISKINWIFLREGVDDFEQSLAQLFELLERQKTYVRQHTELLDAALQWERHQRQSRYLLVGGERQQAEAWLTTRFKDEQPPCLPTDLHCEFISASTKNANNLMTQVFLCHAESDRAIAERVRRNLMRSGITTWTHNDDIEFGSDFQKAMVRGLEEADNMVFLLSPPALNASNCRQALNYALSLNKRIIPLRAAAVNPTELPERLQNLQYIDLVDNVTEVDYQEDESDLLRILRQEASYYREHKVLLTKALNWERQQHNPCILLRGYELQHALTWLKLAKQHPQHGPTPLQREFIAASEQQPLGIALDVFISYSRADSDIARKLNDSLQRYGKRTWFDQESIASGADFQQEIYRGIEASDHFLFILSPNSVNSPYCADEVDYATKLNKRIITVRHRAVEAANLHSDLAKVQWIDFQGHKTDFVSSFKELIRTLDIDPNRLRVHTRLLVQAIAWDEKGQRDGRLLRGEDLQEAEQWLLEAAGKQPSPTALQGKYIAASRRGSTSRQRTLVTVLGSLLVVAIAGAGAAFVNSRVAAQKQREAKTAQIQAEVLADSLNTDNLLLSNLNIQALVSGLETARKVQQQGELVQPNKRIRAGASLRQIVDSIEEKNRLDGHIGAVWNTDMSPDGELIISAGNDGTVRLWQQNGNLVETLKTGEAAVWDVDFSPDGATFAASVNDGTVWLWQRDGTLIQTLNGHSGPVWNIKFSPDSQTIASASQDGTVRLWEQRGDLVTILEGHDGNPRRPRRQRLGRQLQP